MSLRFDDNDLRELIAVFHAEAEEQLEAMEQACLQLEDAPSDTGAVQALFRLTHTLKGSAAAVGAQSVASVAHAVEDLLAQILKGERRIETKVITALLDAVDALREGLAEAAAGPSAPVASRAALLARLAALAAGEARGSVPPERHAGAGEMALRPSSAETLRVSVGKLDRVLELTGELAIARGRVRALLEHAGAAGRAAADALEDSERLFLDLEEAVMSARIVPLGPLFRRYARLVRETARISGKQARLVIESASVEVDTALVEPLRDALVHLVRNAVDHGIEPPEARKAAGKSPVGRVVLGARYEAGGVVITVGDDGAGLSGERILEQAAARGIAAGAGPAGDPARLIFEPGLSTSEGVTELSGRGVGMDAVLRRIEALRGTVTVESHEGQGLTVIMRVPLTTATIEGFSVSIGGEVYVVPMEAIVGVMEMPAGPAGKAPAAAGVLPQRGEALPFLRLRPILGIPGAATTRENVLVIAADGQRAGLVVEELHESRQVVMKPLARALRAGPWLTASTILGDGRVALILDVVALTREALRAAPRAFDAPLAAAPDGGSPAEPARRQAGASTSTLQRS